MSEQSLQASPTVVRAPDEGRAAGALKAGPLPPGLVRLRDGLYFDTSLPVPALLAGITKIFLSKAYFIGLDYPILTKVLYNVGPPLPQADGDGRLVRFATSLVRFEARRRALYRTVRIDDGDAEYIFEDMTLRGADARHADGTARLDVDEFVADLWRQGVRFGLDLVAVEAAIRLGKLGPVLVARKLPLLSGRDTMIINLQDMNRSYVPRQMANGRIDLLSFANHSPHVKKHTRLLKKVAGAEGYIGYELSGQAMVPAPIHDTVLRALAGPGTEVEARRDGEYLVATRDGYMNVDPVNGHVSVDAKIVSHDGVSNRTTGNLRLNAEYEEFGGVQEQRRVDGGDITIHGDVFGNINSRGGRVLLHRNMVGGSVLNAGGDIEIKGVVSSAVLQTKCGTVRVQRAEGCIISGSNVFIEQASNCEIIADEVQIGLAEGCAIAGRGIDIDAAGPRKQIEMQVFALVPDMSGFKQKVAQIEAKAGEIGPEAAKRHQEIDRLNNLPDVRNYQMLNDKLRKGELTLSPDQAQLFQKMADTVALELKTVDRLWIEIQEMDAQKNQLLGQISDIVRQQRAVAGKSRCILRQVNGETLVHTLVFDPNGDPVHHKAPKDIKAMLRVAQRGQEAIFSGGADKFEWIYDAMCGDHAPD